MAVDMNLYALPEGCIANALSLTSPKDACRLSLVASTFRSAAQSDAVWDRFLPADYQDILARSKEGLELLRSLESKKQLYLHLCDHPILIDDATKSFSLEKGSGKKCYMLAAKDLMIVWGDTPRYWRWVSMPESRFPTVAELLDVCWFEIRGKIQTSMLSPNTTYSASLVFTTKSRTYGFDYQPAETSVAIGGEESQTRAVYLDSEGAQRHNYQIIPRWRTGSFQRRNAVIRRPETESTEHQDAQLPKQRRDRWMEIELGEFFVKEGQDVEVVMSLLEVKAGNWKSGLIVEGIEIRPKVDN
ncbi:hypothetical protein M9H77_34897 [Catharanthus roseus]|uniref:Uncharacterized protein n=1 Tax=Catharanthus roseus TaxID=4058 RepID=A0ACB9ZMG6_CATRO|nr:hypothetical protein M9H77_34897 [Catharanthus roseus]